ncbi:MAG: leucine-rich repeat protein [Lachnospiraceae bacterium]|nr:leucine-rich repeat protein [Lachnospiraceae bacterium]
MSIKLWDRETKEYTQSRYVKQGDIFSFLYEKQYYFFGRILVVEPKKYCIAEIFDHVSEQPEIDEQTILTAGRMMPPFNVDTKYTFQDKLMKWDWRIIGHQEGFTAPDQDELAFARKDSELGWIKEDLKGMITQISEQEAPGYMRILFRDPQVNVLREAILQKLRNVNPKPNPASADEEDLFRYAEPTFAAKKYAEVIEAILAFPEEKTTRRLAGLLISALNNSERYDESIECLDRFKALFSEDMYRWYYYYGYALLHKKDLDKLPPVIESGLEECEKAYAAGTVAYNDYASERGHFLFFRYRRKEFLDELENSKFINGFVIRDGRMIRYEGDPEVTEIVIPDGVREVEMGSFRNNKNIKSLVFPEGVEKIGPFSGMSNLEKITFPTTLREIWYGALEDTGWYQKQPKGQIICGKALYKYTGDEEEVVVEDGIETIVTGAFRGNKTLRRVVVPDSVTVIWAGVFKDCANLSEVILPKRMDFLSSNSFENCVSLREITLPDGMTALGNDVFKGCVNLREGILPDTIVQLYGGVFDGCKSLEKVHLPAMAEGLDYGVENWIPRVEGRMFRGCEKLMEVTIPGRIQKIMDETFAGCTSIQKIVFENPETMLGKDTFGRKKKYPEVLYETSPELPLHLSDGDIKQYIDLNRLPDEVKALLFVKRQSKSLVSFWEKSITKDNVEAIADKINELKATKLSAKEKKTAKLFFEQYGALL